MTFANGLSRSFFILGVFALGGTAGILVMSSASGQPDDFQKPLGPPPEMVEACNGSAAGDNCTVRLRGHAMDGICRVGPAADSPLACVPKGPPPGISAAIEACKDRAAGDSCTVNFDDRTIDGTCGPRPHGDASLICRPTRRP